MRLAAACIAVLAIVAAFIAIPNVAHADAKLVGTWNVMPHFPDTCRPECACPPPVGPPRRALQTYEKSGSFTEVAGGTLLRTPALGTWERSGHHYRSAYSFFLFNFSATSVPNFTQAGRQVATATITLDGRDEFVADVLYDNFDPLGNLVASDCPLTVTGTRFAP